MAVRAALIRRVWPGGLLALVGCTAPPAEAPAAPASSVLVEVPPSSGVMVVEQPVPEESPGPERVPRGARRSLSWSWQAPDGASIAVRSGRIELGRKLLFQFGKPDLKDASQQDIDRLVAFLQAHPKIERLAIEGHTDSRGSRRFNVRLSDARARAVATTLADRGIDCARLFSKGFGDTRPIVSNQTKDGRAKNRRMDLRIATFAGRERVDVAGHNSACDR